jgi:transposase-like protein
MESMIEKNEMRHYDEKHPRPSDREVDFINGLVPKGCPFCFTDGYVKAEKNSDGIQRYRCLSCGSRFTVMTGTIFDSRKIPITEWVEYLRFLFEYHSVSASSRDNKNAETTGFYWLGKVFRVLSGCQNGIMLGGKVYLDKTFFLGVTGKEDIQGRQETQGISKNKIGIGVATDGTDVLIMDEGVSK